MSDTTDERIAPTELLLLASSFRVPSLRIGDVVLWDTLAIAEELNIGLDSLVFLDDSDFECASVRVCVCPIVQYLLPLLLWASVRLAC